MAEGEKGGVVVSNDSRPFVVPSWLIPSLLTLVLAVSTGVLGVMIEISTQHAELRERIAVLETKDTSIQHSVDRMLQILDRTASGQ